MAQGELTDDEVFGTPAAQPVTSRPLPPIAGVNSFGQPLTPGEGEMSDADVFAGAQPGMPGVGDPRPVSQQLGFGEGVQTVARNLAGLLERPGPLAMMPSGDPRAVTAHVLSQPIKAILDRFQGPLDKMAKTYRPGTAGKIGGEVLASAPLAFEGGPLIIGAKPLAFDAGPLITGALQGYLTSDSKDPLGKVADTAAGAIGGKIGDKVFAGLSSLVAPKVRGAAQWAIDNGIRLTPGAIAGGPLAGVENNVVSKLAFAGPLVRGGQTRTIEDFNKATINNALAPAGLSLPAGVPAGNKAIDAAHQALGDAYDAIVPKLSAATDPQFAAAIQGLRASADDLSGSYAAKAGKLVDGVLARFDPNTGEMTGADLKTLDSHLGGQARRFGKAQDPLANEYGDFASELQAHLRDLTERANPDVAPQLQGINNGWAQLVRIEKAGTNAATQGGVFTPDGLINAAKMTDSSVRANATARGQALLQDWANQAKEVVPAKMPAPGSPLSNIMEGLVTLGVGKESGMHGVGAAAAVEAALSALYSPPGQSILRSVMTQRPQAIRDLVARLQDLRGVTSDAGAIALPKVLPPPQSTISGLLPYLPAGPPK